MKLNSTLKLAAWIILLLSVSSLVVLRYSAMAAGTSTVTDAFLLLLWIGLMLAPAIQDAHPFEGQLKQSVESLRDQVQHLMLTVQTQTQSVNVHNYPIPPSDREITKRQKQAEEVLGEASLSRSLPDDPIPQDPEINNLFNLRRALEAELSRIESTRFGLEGNYRRFDFVSANQRLVDARLLPPKLGAAMTDVYAICSAAIHGEEMSPKQLAYARKIGPRIVSALRQIQ